MVTAQAECEQQQLDMCGQRLPMHTASRRKLSWALTLTVHAECEQLAAS